MFPYLQAPVWQIGGITVYSSELLLLASLITGAWIVTRRAVRMRLSRAQAWQLYFWMVAFGYAGGHLVKFAVYYPGPLPDNLAEAFTTFRGMASFGGLFGSLIGAAAWAFVNRSRVPNPLAYVDLFAYAFPFAWVFGRASCALVHDHPGIPTASWLGVRFPAGTRYDLGLLEFFYTLLLAALFLILDRRPRPAGFFLATLMLLYGPFRHALDRLHVDTPELLGTSPDRVFGIVAVAIGLAVIAKRNSVRPAAAEQS